jgi:hypothetical protein
VRAVYSPPVLLNYMSTRRDPTGKQPIVMCASCWRVQVLHHALAPEWVDPTMFMAQADGGAGDYRIRDGYCDPCLTAFVSHLRDVKMKTAHERLNA